MFGNHKHERARDDDKLSILRREIVRNIGLGRTSLLRYDFRSKKTATDVIGEREEYRPRTIGRKNWGDPCPRKEEETHVVVVAARGDGKVPARTRQNSIAKGANCRLRMAVS